MNKLRFGIIPLAALIVFMAACDTDADNGEGEETQPGVISVTVAPKNYIVHRGYQQSFIAAVSGIDDKTVIWSIEQTGLHANTTIGQDGVLSVSPDEEQTALTIKAALAADTTKYGTAVVSIPAPTVTGVEISLTEGIVISPWNSKNKALNVNKGKTEQFQANVVGENFPSQDVTWTITGTVSSGTSINGNGLLTVSSAETLGATFTVRAVSQVDTGKSDIITVTVNPPVMTSFTVVPSDTVISPTTPVEFTVTVLGNGNIQGLYNISGWTVTRTDERPIAVDEQMEDDDGSLVTIQGTRFEGNALHMGPNEKLGEWDGDEETGTYTPYLPFLLVVTITLDPLQLEVANTVNTVEGVPSIKIELTPDAGIVES